MRNMVYTNQIIFDDYVDNTYDEEIFEEHWEL